MGRRKSLSNIERQRITKLLRGGFSNKRISKLLNRDMRTIQKAVANINFTRKSQNDKGKQVAVKYRYKTIKVQFSQAPFVF